MLRFFEFSMPKVCCTHAHSLSLLLLLPIEEAIVVDFGRRQNQMAACDVCVVFVRSLYQLQGINMFLLIIMSFQCEGICVPCVSFTWDSLYIFIDEQWIRYYDMAYTEDTSSRTTLDFCRTNTIYQLWFIYKQ